MSSKKITIVKILIGVVCLTLIVAIIAFWPIPPKDIKLIATLPLKTVETTGIDDGITTSYLDTIIIGNNINKHSKFISDNGGSLVYESGGGPEPVGVTFPERQPPKSDVEKLKLELSILDLKNEKDRLEKIVIKLNKKANKLNNINHEIITNISSYLGKNRVLDIILSALIGALASIILSFLIDRWEFSKSFIDKLETTLKKSLKNDQL